MPFLDNKSECIRADGTQHKTITGIIKCLVLAELVIKWHDFKLA